MKRLFIILCLFINLPQINAQSFWNALGEAMQTAAKNAPYDRSSIRNSIRSWNSCRNGVLTCKNGAIAYYGTNGYQYTMSVPAYLSSKMKEVHYAGGIYTDINITDEGYYILVWNDTQWYGYLPQGLLDKLRSLPSSTRFRSVSFNDSGNYIIVTSDNFYTSSSSFLLFYQSKKEELGELYSANIWQNGVIFCFEKGPTFYGTVPTNVINAMNSFQGVPQYIKFNHRGDYLICSSTGYCAYNIVDIDKSQLASTSSNYPSNNNGGINSGSGVIYTTPPQTTAHPQKCGPCYGTGKCSTCNGSGISSAGHNHICGACGGSGRCTTCKGTGTSGVIYY